MSSVIFAVCLLLLLFPLYSFVLTPASGSTRLSVCLLVDTAIRTDLSDVSTHVVSAAKSAETERDAIETAVGHVCTLGLGRDS